jgi:hypothetical protein
VRLALTVGSCQKAVAPRLRNSEANHRVRAFYFLALISWLALPACGRWERVRECRHLTGLINQHLDQIEQRSRLTPRSRETYHDVARGYEKLADDLGKLSPKYPGLARLLPEYQSFALSAARVADQAALGVQADRRWAWTAAKSELGPLAQQQKALNHILEQTCRELQ